MSSSDPETVVAVLELGDIGLVQNRYHCTAGRLTVGLFLPQKRRVTSRSHWARETQQFLGLLGM
jgi:hypothetical protein